MECKSYRAKERLEQAERIWLFLDYDGTLADFAPTPDHIRVDQELIQLLTSLAEQPAIRVAIISGRGLPQIMELVPVRGIFLAGSYGVELLTGEGERLDRLDLEQLRPALERIKPEIENLIRDREGYFLEDKGWTLALHAKYADRTEARDVMAAARKLMSESINDRVYRIQGGSKFLEVGPLSANKGQTIEYLLEKHSWPGSLLVYFGDDERDEEAFKVIRARGGIACRVGSDGKETVADCSLASTQEARAWLQSLLEQIER